jgi:hypothetical protein
MDASGQIIQATEKTAGEFRVPCDADVDVQRWVGLALSVTKMQRIVEVLLGSVSLFQLMLGKLIGMVGVSLTIARLSRGGFS